jgi:hypothetical protein
MPPPQYGPVFPGLPGVSSIQLHILQNIRMNEGSSFLTLPFDFFNST